MFSISRDRRVARASVAALTGLLLAAPGTLLINSAGAANGSYFVDCRAGNDRNSGTSEGQAWKSASAVSNRSFSAGDKIRLAKGCTFDGGLTLQGTGTAAAPIVLSAYGTGAAPIVSNSAQGGYSNGIDARARFSVIENLQVSNVANAGVGVAAADVTVRNVDVSRAGLGVEVTGAGKVTIDHVAAHDLRMARNTVGGDDDYGAVGFVVQAPNVEIRNSSCVNCTAPSHDFGQDGGFVEVYNNGDNLYVHHNTARNVNGFVEVGAGAARSSANNMRFVDNVIVNSGNLVNIHEDDHFALPTKNLLFADNTVYQSVKPPQSMFYSAGSAVTARDNIFASTFAFDTGSAPASHVNNLYFNSASTRLGYPLGSGERFGDPKFVDTARGDFRLQVGSAARGMGSGGRDVGADIGTTSPPTTPPTSQPTTTRPPVSPPPTTQPPATIPPTTAPPVTPPTSSQGAALYNPGSRLVLDVKDGRTNTGATIIGWKAHGGTNQQWSFPVLTKDRTRVTIVGKGSGKCLDVTGLSSWGGMLMLNSCNGGASQEWQLQSVGSNVDGKAAFRIAHAASGMVVTLSPADSQGFSYALLQPKSTASTQLFVRQ